MNQSLIKTFLAIVETGSLVKASNLLHVTQSTVTSRLKALEQDVGQVLVHRQKSGVTLTASGIKFKRYAEAMQNIWQQALLETSLPMGMETVCNLGCDPDLWPTIGRSLVSKIRQLHSTTALSIKLGNRQQLEDWLASGLIDAALTYREASKGNLTSTVIANEQLAVFSTIENGPIKHDPNYTYFDAGPEFGRDHATAYTDAGIAKNSFDSALWCLEHLLDFGGSAYLPEKLAQPHVVSGELFKLDDGTLFNRNAYIITNDRTLIGWPWLPDLAKEVADDAQSGSI